VIKSEVPEIRGIDHDRNGAGASEKLRCGGSERLLWPRVKPIIVV
jgi:hypothetical protein